MITATWIGLNLLPLILTVILCLVSQSWGWSIAFVIFYLLAVVPYGFFVSLPLMVKFFDHAPDARRK